MARPRLSRYDCLVVKVGTTSVVGADGRLDHTRIATLCEEIADLHEVGIRLVVVSSGAIAAGLEPLKLSSRPTDLPTLQAAAAVGQGLLLARYRRLLAERGVLAAQVLLTGYDFMHRQQYLNARNTFDRLFDLGSVPVVNENDTVAVDEIRFGDNDRLAALVANLVRAKLLALLTDTNGVYSADPRQAGDARLLDEVMRITPELERAAGGRGSQIASGGMASKVAAAWMATFSGVGVAVANAATPGVLGQIAQGRRVGTYFHPRPHRLSARRLWIAFAQPARGTVVVDEGARRAVVEQNRSLLPVGVVEVRGIFESGDTVDVMQAGGEVFARGLVGYAAHELEAARGRSLSELDRREVVHRDHLVVLEGGAGE